MSYPLALAPSFGPLRASFPASSPAPGAPGIAINKPLAFASTTQRTAHRRAIDTLRSDHNQMLKRLAALPVPPAPSVYDTHSELGFLLLDQIVYLRALVDAFAPLFERCADDAADHGGARAESFDLIRGAA